MEVSHEKISISYIFAFGSLACQQQNAIPETANKDGVTTFSWGQKDTPKGALLQSRQDFDSRAREILAEAGAKHRVLDSSVDATKLRQMVKTSSGAAIAKYQQIHKGLPVIGGDLNVMVDRFGNHVATSGNFKDLKQLADLEFTFDVNKAVSSKVSKLTPPRIKGVIFPKEELAVPAFEVEAFDDQGILKLYYYHGSTGELLKEIVLTVSETFEEPAGDVCNPVQVYLF